MTTPDTAPAAVVATAPADVSDLPVLRARGLTVPVSGIVATQLSDTYTQSRAAGRPHEAIDIMAPRGTPVLAVEDGPVAKLFLSQAGGITLYQFDPDGRYAYYYAHLDRYADGISESAPLRKGQVIGYVGSTGNASPDAPHLHFAIFKLGPEKQWWRGTALNPFMVWRDATRP
ncbi:MAG: M23 family metallopeptidase [Haliea sp.]|nr:MAG: M23 family metallopeptidase [Haliea sp.]